MMKKLLSVFVLAMIVMATLCGFAFPADMSGDRYVYDEGDYLSASEEAEIQAAIEQVSGDIKADILVIFTDQPESDSERNCAENAAKRWRDAGYASKKKQETIVFYVDMANRRFFTNEYNAKEKFRLTDADIDNITYAVLPYMSAGDNGAAALTAVEAIGEYGRPGFFQTFWAWLMSGCIGGGIATMIGVGSHNAARTHVTRRYYLKDHAVNVVASSEFFTGSTERTIDHTPQQRTESSSGSSGITHSSSGSSGNHGGGASF